MNGIRLLRGSLLLSFAGLLAAGAAVGQTGAAGDGGGKDGTVKLTPAQFDKEFRKSQKATMTKYNGKTLELTGKVLRATRHFSGKPIVELEAGNEFAGVACYTVVKEPWGTFARGQTVKVTGKFP